MPEELRVLCIQCICCRNLVMRTSQVMHRCLITNRRKQELLKEPRISSGCSRDRGMVFEHHNKRRISRAFLGLYYMQPCLELQWVWSSCLSFYPQRCFSEKHRARTKWLNCTRLIVQWYLAIRLMMGSNVYTGEWALRIAWPGTTSVIVRTQIRFIVIKFDWCCTFLCRFMASHTNIQFIEDVTNLSPCLVETCNLNWHMHCNTHPAL